MSTTEDALSIIAGFDNTELPIGTDGTPLEYLRSVRDVFVETGTWNGWSETHGGYWFVSKWEDVMRVYSDSAQFSSAGVPVIPPFTLPSERPLMIAGYDAPAHMNYRRLVQHWFTPRAVAELEQGIKEDTNRIIDGFQADGRADLAQDLAAHVPRHLLARLIGIPFEEAERFEPWVYAIAHASSNDVPEIQEALTDLETWFDAFLRDRRAHVGNDLMSELISTGEINGQPLSDTELRDYFTILMLGTIENTALLLGDASWYLATNPDMRRRLQHDPAVLKPATDEFLRYFGVGVGAARIAVNDTEIGGLTIKAGDKVLPIGPVANRDPSRFDQPDALIPARSPNPHVTLGNGPHRCLGAHLIKVEFAAVVETLLQRIPDFSLSSTASTEWSFGPSHGFTRVPVEWS